MFTIKAKINQEIILNPILKKLGLKNSFITEQGNQDWLQDINNDPESPQAHLKPKDRNLTIKELKDMFWKYTEIGRLEFDLYFFRTSDKQMKLIAQFVQKQITHIEYVQNSDLLIERGEVTREQEIILKGLEKKEPKPKKLPKTKQTKNDLQSGVLLCKSWSNEPFWVAYGNVKEPKFMKKKIYEDDSLNDLYKTKDDIAVLLIPLNDFSGGFIERVFNQVWQMGVREHPIFFNMSVYKCEYERTREVVKELSEFYTKEELVEQIKMLNKHICNIYQTKSFKKEIISFEGDKKLNYVNLPEVWRWKATYENSEERKLLILMYLALNEKMDDRHPGCRGNIIEYKKEEIEIMIEL